jgi:ATP-dependent RNA helicase DeaD
METFIGFALSEEIQRGIGEAGFKVPSPIQNEAIPLVLKGYDIVAQAHTGTGKTAAFGLPIMSKIEPKKSVQFLVITPTRELAMQVSDELYKLGSFAGIKTVTVYGGMSASRQVDLISRGAQVVVATPGRMLDLLGSKRIKKFNPSFVVLDEADEMLDMGFLDDIKEIFNFLPKQRQTLLFSATMPEAIKRLAKTILNEPKFISITKKETTNKDIEQKYFVIEEKERDDALIRLIESNEINKAIVFCRTKKETDRVGTLLITHGFLAKGLHGDMAQREREEVIKAFKASKLEILVATDVAARGLDVSDVTHVFNYHIPFDAESYVHRIGRTGRAGNKGVAITLVTPLEFRELQRIKKLVGTNIENEEVPTINDIKKASFSKLIDEIKKQNIKDESKEILEILENEIDISTIVFKLISKLIDSQSIKGPEKIGLDTKKVKRLLEKLKHNNTHKNSRSRRSPRNSSTRRYRR